MDSFPDFRVFIEQMIEEKHGSSLLDTERTSMYEDILPRLNQWILLKGMTEIGQTNPEKLKELVDLAKEDTKTEEIIQILRDSLPDMQSFLTQSLLTFKQSYLDAS